MCGPVYDGQAGEAIGSCSVFVLMLSAQTNGSQEAIRQIELAVKSAKPIVTVQIDRTPMGNRIGYYLGARQVFDAAAKPLRRHFHSLYTTLCDMLNRTPESKDKGRLGSILRSIFLNKFSLFILGFFVVAVIIVAISYIPTNIGLSDRMVERSVMLTGAQGYPSMSEDGALFAYAGDDSIYVEQTKDFYKLMVIPNPFENAPTVGICGKDMLYAASGSRVFLYPLRLSGVHYEADLTNQAKGLVFKGIMSGGPTGTVTFLLGTPDSAAIIKLVQFAYEEQLVLTQSPQGSWTDAFYTDDGGALCLADSLGGLTVLDAADFEKPPLTAERALAACRGRVAAKHGFSPTPRTMLP